MKFNPATWTRWLKTSPPAGRAAATMEAADASAIQRLAWAGEVVTALTHDDDGQVTREDLVRYSSRGSNTDEQLLVAAWVATMIWGSGKAYGRGPWRLRQSLLDHRLPNALRHTVARVIHGELADAYRMFEVEGIGPSFFTKWLWVSTLASHPVSRPLILDARVAATLALVSPPRSRWTSGGHAYSNFVDALHAVADGLRADFPGIDAEKVEWLLFCRSTTDCTVCLHDWLKKDGARFLAVAGQT